jgi:uncharacterized repeat protein (TIGR03803 family)
MIGRQRAIALLMCGAYGAAQPPGLTTIYNFSGTSDGGNPHAPVVIGEGGVLYGTTWSGGAHSLGTVFSVTPPASPGGAWTETVLYSFQGGTGDGASPNSRLVTGSAGVFYGATAGGGMGGTLFSLTPPASPAGQWTEAVIHFFGATANDATVPNPRPDDGPSQGYSTAQRSTAQTLTELCSQWYPPRRRTPRGRRAYSTTR